MATPASISEPLLAEPAPSKPRVRRYLVAAIFALAVWLLFAGRLQSKPVKAASRGAWAPVKAAQDAMEATKNASEDAKQKENEATEAAKVALVQQREKQMEMMKKKEDNMDTVSKKDRKANNTYDGQPFFLPKPWVEAILPEAWCRQTAKSHAEGWYSILGPIYRRVFNITSVPPILPVVGRENSESDEDLAARQTFWVVIIFVKVVLMSLINALLHFFFISLLPWCLQNNTPMNCSRCTQMSNTKVVSTFILYHVTHLLFIFMIVDVSVTYGYMSVSTGLDWELWGLWLDWLTAVMTCTALVKYFTNMGGNIDASYGDVFLMIVPGLGSDAHLAKDMVFLGLCFQAAHQSQNMICCVLGNVLGVLSLLVMFVPAVQLYYGEEEDGAMSSFIASHWPIIMAGPKAISQARTGSWMTDWGDWVMVKVLPQVTTAKYYVALYNELPQAILEVAYCFVFEFEPFVVLGLISSVAKIVLIPLMRFSVKETILGMRLPGALVVYAKTTRDKTVGRDAVSSNNWTLEIVPDLCNLNLELCDGFTDGDVAQEDDEGKTQLHTAAHLGFDRTAKMLIDAKAEVDKADNEGYTALHVAAQKGTEKVARVLLEAEADISKADTRMMTPLHHTIVKRKPEVAKLILEHLTSIDQGSGDEQVLPGDEQIRQLAQVLPRNFVLEGQTLKTFNIGEAGALVLADALKKRNTITKLDIGGNKIGEAGIRALADALKVNTTLTELNLHNNGIREAGARALADALKMNNALMKLYLQGNSIGKAGASALADALKENNKLEELNLWNNDIKEAGARAVADLLKTNTTLKKLILENNGIGEAGTRALADMLKKNEHFTDLSLPGNGIGEAGASALADALKKNKFLTNLNLYNNGIGQVGAKALADALKMNDTFETLNLGRNSIGEEGALALADALKKNRTLTELNLDGTGIGQVGKKALRAAWGGRGRGLFL